MIKWQIDAKSTVLPKPVKPLIKKNSRSYKLKQKKINEKNNKIKLKYTIQFRANDKPFSGCSCFPNKLIGPKQKAISSLSMEQYKAQGIVHLESDFMTTERKKNPIKRQQSYKKNMQHKTQIGQSGRHSLSRGRNWAQTEEGRRPHPRVPCPPDRPRAGDVFPPPINRLSDVESPPFDFPKKRVAPVALAPPSRAAPSPVT